MLNKKELLALTRKACETLMAKFTPETLPPAGHFHYHQGVFLDGMYRFYKLNHEEKYLAYIKSYYDSIIDEYGNLMFDRDQLDSLQVGLLLFPLFEETGDERYLIAAKKLLHIVYGINKTSEGGFWHKDKYPYQMWLDGLYMAGPFLLTCAKYFGESDLIAQVLYQEKLMFAHLYNRETGLLYHAWDEKCQQPWANQKTGCSPEVWGRSAGWYGTALVDMLKLLPPKHPERVELMRKLAAYSKTLMSYQDNDSHCWYQIVDKGTHADNWLESSCSALFVYTIAEAMNHGLIGKDLSEAIQTALAGIIKQMVVVSGEHFALNSICIGTSAGTYDYYVSRPTSENDLHGVAVFIWAVLAVYDLLED
ncbi:unsaturated rhamnogalacturonyl hydrolase YteR [Lactococcus hodotermopsidis]|uniref:Unsaturated rhamnogalacturonyl hydrolase YteR n=1 Tax=Pseudolactococcus hodotermopsidis TaxID=2709157 RepID=A0A6A0B952_9LACT|nr:glycoside hydrolase family 88 protein [Lactococcus hodotermopsidis]GFH41949.1 unsaturated rhamnogalacturonyl hydrolase YteR [Lactococcus hodotermopsidis]